MSDTLLVLPPSCLVLGCFYIPDVLVNQRLLYVAFLKIWKFHINYMDFILSDQYHVFVTVSFLIVYNVAPLVDPPTCMILSRP
jgi:hypothetical protein